MPKYIVVLCVVLGIIVVIVGGFFLYFFCSPMPVVRRLRKGDDAGLSYPPDYDIIMKAVRIQKDMEYASSYGRNRFDLYLPEEGEKCPLILWIHGGAFVAGDKIGVENWGIMLAHSGYAVAAMNYEWAPEASYPAQLIQVTEVYKAIAELAKKNGRIDMRRIAVAGDSAGAHLASQFVLLHTNPAFANRMNIFSPLEADALKCALLYCGPYDFQKMLQFDNRMLNLFVSRIGWSYMGMRKWYKAPLLDTLVITDFVTEDFVPAYITDGNRFSFESQGRALGEKLREAGVKIVERYFDSAQFGEVNHEYQMKLDTPNAMDCLKDTIEFLKEHISA